MNEREYVEGILCVYKQTSRIRDFREEVIANLTDRIKELLNEGRSYDEAFRQAKAELGDITEIADEIGVRMNKRQLNMRKKWAVRGPLSGALALLMVIAFFVLGWVYGFKYSWPVLLLIPFSLCLLSAIFGMANWFSLLTGAVWSLCTALFFVFGGMWGFQYSWIMFLVAPFLTCVLHAIRRGVRKY